MSKTYLIRTFGCQMNEHDTEQIAGVFAGAGMTAAHSIDDADVVVLNTCCIRENADNKLYGTLGHLKALKDRRPDLEIVVGGCLAQKDRDDIARRAPHVDVVMGTHNVGRVVDLLDRSRREGPVVEILEAAALEDGELFPSALPRQRDAGYSAWVTIQIGCDNSCAFCIVPSVRGDEMSRPFGELVGEVEALAAEGVSEITLLGQNVNSYGRDLAVALRRPGHGIDERATAGASWIANGRRLRPLFPDLLRAVGGVEGISRVRFTSPHPKDLGDDTIGAMAEVDAVCEHLHLPLQSGSDSVLAAMHRGYTAERYLQRVAAARAAIPDLAVTTDIIVGFPGETDRDADATLEVVVEADLDAAYTFVYSARPGTEAAEMVDRFVPHRVAVERMERLRAVVERLSLRHHRERIGRVEDVVIEGRSKTDAAMLTGRTRHNRLVHFPSTEPVKPGTGARVLVTEGHLSYLMGELTEITHPARHRTKIPVAAS